MCARPADRQGGGFDKDSISYIKLYPTKAFLHRVPRGKFMYVKK